MRMSQEDVQLLADSGVCLYGIRHRVLPPRGIEDV